ncbi:class I SAM-dependent methyltransferase [Streptomyces sp. NPDC046887]|uniref:O-methyltransferase n=1 Tax=Streptomyces sp. NPDC046887 TaxID=3155472 RepID=UPI0033E4C557
MAPNTAHRLGLVAIAALAAVRQPVRTTDPFAAVQAETRRHRRRHGCGAVTYGDGSLPAVIAAATGARRIVEVGTALGYTALCMAQAAPDARVETVESDEEHVRLARAAIAAHADPSVAERITVRPGRAERVLRELPGGGYDLAFFDGFTPTGELVAALHRLLRPGGSLLVGNLVLGPEPAVSVHLSDPDRWQSHAFGETALCVKR